MIPACHIKQTKQICYSRWPTKNPPIGWISASVSSTALTCSGWAKLELQSHQVKMKHIIEEGKETRCCTTSVQLKKYIYMYMSPHLIMYTHCHLRCDIN